MGHTGHADLPLHYGHVPPWLANRMARLGGAIVEAIVTEYGKTEMLRRLSDPFWFQALGCVLGMDWHSSGITTSVMGALKKSVNPLSKQLGIYFCGGKGKYSRDTPFELEKIALQTGINANTLVKASKLSAKVDNTAIQDGFQLYLHCFIVTDEGEWAVVQQGMKGETGMARRYHWHSPAVKSFTEDPHTFIYGKNQGLILNLTDRAAQATRQGLLNLTAEHPERLMKEIKKLAMPVHHDVKARDIDLKRLGAVLALAYERELRDFESLLLLEGVGPRTIQSLTLVSEVIHGTPSRFSDPARFSFAHGGKDGHPFPVPTKTYDECIQLLRSSLDKAKIDHSEKKQAIKQLSVAASRLEKDFTPNRNFDQLIAKERAESYRYGGRTIYGKAKPDKKEGDSRQLTLF